MNHEKFGMCILIKWHFILIITSNSDSYIRQMILTLTFLEYVKVRRYEYCQKNLNSLCD